MWPGVICVCDWSAAEGGGQWSNLSGEIFVMFYASYDANWFKVNTIHNFQFEESTGLRGKAMLEAQDRSEESPSAWSDNVLTHLSMDQVVIAKWGSYPPWPGTVTGYRSGSRARGSDMYKIEFLGVGLTYQWVKRTYITDYSHDTLNLTKVREDSACYAQYITARDEADQILMNDNASDDDV